MEKVSNFYDKYFWNKLLQNIIFYNFVEMLIYNINKKENVAVLLCCRYIRFVGD